MYYHLLEEEGHARLSDMINVVIIDLSVLELDGVREETAKAATPLDDSSDCHAKHQIICFYIIFLFLILIEMFIILKMLGCRLPWQGLTEYTSRSLIIQRFIQRITNHLYKVKFLIFFKLIFLTALVIGMKFQRFILIVKLA